MRNYKIAAVCRNRKAVEEYPMVVSLDDHTSNIYMYGVNILSGELMVDKNIMGDYHAVRNQLEKMGSKEQVMVLVECGNKGFSPYRYFVKHGYHCKLIATSSIPNRGKEQKTDRDDAIANLDYYMAGLLRFVHIPDAADEDARECLRYRYDLAWSIGKQKQRILSLVKRQGQQFSGTKTNWTVQHHRWLKAVELPICTRIRLDMMLTELETLKTKTSDLDLKLTELFLKNDPYGKLMALYQTLPGFGFVGSMTLIVEGHDLHRFSTADRLMNYVGLIPRKYSSGTHDPARGITKAGNSYLRLAFVGAAKFYTDRRLMRSEASLTDSPVLLREFIMRCQDRLYSRYKYLRNQGKCSNKAKCAIARELCGFIWELIVKVQPQIEKLNTTVKAAA